MSVLTLAVDNSTVHVPHGRHYHVGWLSSWQGMVSVAGITFAAVLVLMTIAFLCYHRVAGSRRPRKTQVGQVLLRPRGNGSHLDPRTRRADGASASLWSDRTTSPADSPTRTFLLTSSRPGAAPAYYVDGPYPPNDALESNVDTLGRPCPAYRIYGFPAYYGSGQSEPGRYYDAGAVPACVNCSQRRSQSPCGVACTEHTAAGHGAPTGEVFIDGPPRQDRAGAGGGRARPPTEGSDSETTPVKTRRAPAWNHEDAKRPADALRRAVRPDGQSPDDGGTEWLTTKTATSCSTLSELDNVAALDDDQLEYDDYIPQLPGSYFQMDPHAYTLTWSKQPAAPAANGPHHQTMSAGSTQRSLSASETSLDCR